MEKSYAFLFAFMITGLIASNVFLINTLSEKRNLESVQISRVLDGDTLELTDGRILRLLNINSPEKNQPLSELATNFLKHFQNQTIQVEISGTGRYGRYLARLYSPDYLNLELVKKGFVHKYLVDDSELNVFSKEEEKSREKGLGIWNKSKYYGCLDVEINKKEEFLIINNKCNLNLSLFLKDESTKTYNIKINEKEKITVFSRQGENSKSRLYLQSKRNIWNDDKDSIFIRDSNGYLIYYDSYGY